VDWSHFGNCFAVDQKTQWVVVENPPETLFVAAEILSFVP
jgi:hypothetical protein